MSELDGICHEKHEPINIDAKTRERLHVYLMEKAPRGQGYSTFIEEALDRVGADRLPAPPEIVRAIARVSGMSEAQARPIADGLVAPRRPQD